MPKMSQIREEQRTLEGHKHTYLNSFIYLDSHIFVQVHHGIFKDVLMGITKLSLQLNNLSEVALDVGMARPMTLLRLVSRKRIVHNTTIYFWILRYSMLCKYRDIRYRYNTSHSLVTQLLQWQNKLFPSNCRVNFHLF